MDRMSELSDVMRPNWPTLLFFASLLREGGQRLERRGEVRTLGQHRRAWIARPRRDPREGVAKVELLRIEPRHDLVPDERHGDGGAGDRAYAVRRDEQLPVRVLAPVEVDAAAARRRIAGGRRHRRVLALDDQRQQIGERA